MYGSRPWVQSSNVHEKWTMSAVLSESSMCDVGDTVRGGRGWQLVPPTRGEQLYRLKLCFPGYVVCIHVSAVVGCINQRRVTVYITSCTRLLSDFSRMRVALGG